MKFHLGTSEWTWCAVKDLVPGSSPTININQLAAPVKTHFPFLSKNFSNDTLFHFKLWIWKKEPLSPVFQFHAGPNKHVPEDENVCLCWRPTAVNFSGSNGQISANDSTWAVTRGSLFRLSSPKNFSPSIFNHMLPEVAYNGPWPRGDVLTNRKRSPDDWKILTVGFLIFDCRAHRGITEGCRDALCFITCEAKMKSLLMKPAQIWIVNSKVCLVFCFCLWNSWQLWKGTYQLFRWRAAPFFLWGQSGKGGGVT